MTIETTPLAEGAGGHAIVHIVRFDSDSASSVASNLKGYVERELARSAPKGFLSAVVLEAADGSGASMVSYWESFEDLEETADSAPWEAAMDLCDAISDKKTETAYKIVTATAAA